MAVTPDLPVTNLDTPSVEEFAAANSRWTAC